MIYLHKILPLIVSPLFIVIGLIILGLIIVSRKISFIGISILIICSLPIISKQLIAYLEHDFKLEQISEIENVSGTVLPSIGLMIDF